MGFARRVARGMLQLGGRAAGIAPRWSAGIAMVRKQVPCRSCLECCFHTCRLASPCHALGMGNPCADVATAFFRRFVARPVIFIVTTVPWGLLFDWFMLLLGPALICLATSIVGWCADAPPPALALAPAPRHRPPPPAAAAD